jgi:hypothetical protein
MPEPRSFKKYLRGSIIKPQRLSGDGINDPRNHTNPATRTYTKMVRVASCNWVRVISWIVIVLFATSRAVTVVSIACSLPTHRAHRGCTRAVISQHQSNSRYARSLSSSLSSLTLSGRHSNAAPNVYRPASCDASLQHPSKNRQLTRQHKLHQAL